MGRRTSGIAVAGIIALGVLSAPWVDQAAAGPSVTRFASPNGSGTSCTQDAPCDIIAAAGGAPAGAEVIIEPGQYGSQTSPISDTILGGAQNLDIHGLADKAMPVIFSSATYGLEIASSTIDHISIVHTGSFAGVILTDSTADHVRIESDAIACDINASRIYNSVCSAAGSAAVYTYAKYETSFSTLRNVTAFGSGSATNAVDCNGSVGGDCRIGLINTIADGGGGADVRIFATNGGNAVVTGFNSDFALVSDLVQPDSTGTVNFDDSDIGTSPTFVDEANGNFHEAATSPTIDAGLNGGAEGPIDLDGLPRVLGTAADIGAYEFPSRPDVRTVEITKRGKHSVHVTAVVDTGGLPGAIQVIAHHHGTSVSGDPEPVTTHDKAKPVKLVAAQLKAHTTYKIEVTVADAGGTGSATSGARTRG